MPKDVVIDGDNGNIEYNFEHPVGGAVYTHAGGPKTVLVGEYIELNYEVQTGTLAKPIIGKQIGRAHV